MLPGALEPDCMTGSVEDEDNDELVVGILLLRVRVRCLSGHGVTRQRVPTHFPSFHHFVLIPISFQTQSCSTVVESCLLRW